MGGDGMRQTLLNVLPKSMKDNIRRRLGKVKPWEVGAGLEPPTCPEGMEVGPPDFVGVGAQKAGTSWWFNLILQHPEAFHLPNLEKELHYFGKFWNRAFTDADVTTYHRWFPRPAGRRTGEWTPIYMFHVWTPPLLRQAAPDARILVLLRDPVERFRSGLTHYVSRGAPDDPRIGAEAYGRGRYGEQLAWLLRWFPREQVLVQQYEMCMADTTAELARAYWFLGFDDSFVPAVLDERMNPTQGEKVSLTDERRDHLIELYRDDVARLLADFPHLDVSRWPNFGDLA